MARIVPIILLLGILLAPGRAGEDVAKELGVLAQGDATFDSGMLADGRPPFADSADPQTEDSMKAVASKNNELARLARESDAQTFADLLKNPDAKIRTLALAALYLKDDPHLLPAIFGEVDDAAPTFMRQGDQPQTGSRGPNQPQTIGQIATNLVNTYLKASGYIYGLKPASPQQPGFAHYWQKRKDRSTCMGWFAVQAMKIGRSFQGGGNSKPDFGVILQRMGQLSPDDRALTLLWMRHAAEYCRVVEDDELVKALQAVGPDKLIGITQGHVPSDDPDLQPDCGDRENYGFAVAFLLDHAKALFRAQDADALLAQARLEFAQGKEMDGTLPTDPWWVAAASLQPDRAAAILHEGLAALIKGHRSESEAVAIVVALGELPDGKEQAFATDWYFNPPPDSEISEHDAARRLFVERLTEDPGAVGEGQKFVARLLTDPRARDLDPSSLADLGRGINRWLPTPILSDAEYRQLTGFYGKGQAKKPTPVPGVLERLRASVPQWSS